MTVEEAQLYASLMRENKYLEFKREEKRFEFVKQIVELHGGKVLVESELGIGSTFYISLPL